MDPSQSAMYGLFKWLFDHVFSGQIGMITIPIITIMIILRFILWSRATATGESASAIHNDYQAVREGMRDPQSYRGRMRRQAPQQRRRR